MQQKRNEREQIFPYLLDLLFESLISTLSSLTYEQIVFEYWDFKMTNNREPGYDLFGHDEGESLLRKLCKYLRMYFRNHHTEAPQDFQELL